MTKLTARQAQVISWLMSNVGYRDDADELFMDMNAELGFEETLEVAKALDEIVVMVNESVAEKEDKITNNFVQEFLQIQEE